MRVLYVIFVLCVGALLWVAVAAARHIRRHESKVDRGNEIGQPATDLLSEAQETAERETAPRA